MELTVRDNPDRHRLEAVLDDGTVAGTAHYRAGEDGAAYVFDHTVVDDSMEGQGVGGRLAAGVMDFVRDRGARIVPECSFIRGYMAQHDETRDLLADGVTL